MNNLLTWKLPGVFRHCPPLHKESSNSHSLMSLHIFPVASTSYPLSQIHRYVPIRFSHPPLTQMLGFWAHSLMSTMAIMLKLFIELKTENWILNFRILISKKFVTFLYFRIMKLVTMLMFYKCESWCSWKFCDIKIFLNVRYVLPSPL